MCHIYISIQHLHVHANINVHIITDFIYGHLRKFLRIVTIEFIIAKRVLMF
jgi:hypothetical protein